jgi:hypothetical protein
VIDSQRYEKMKSDSCLVRADIGNNSLFSPSSHEGGSASAQSTL